MPLAFELNRGQTDAKVRFLTRAQNFTVFLMPGETVMRGRNADVLRMKLQNANQSPKVLGESRQRQVSNYYIGNDRSKWLQGVPNFGQVRYRDVYSGIDMVYHSDQRQLEYDFVVKPGADPDQIRVIFEGADQITLTKQGELELKSPAGDSVNHKPVVYQTIDGRRKLVEVEFALANNVVGFKIGEYDRTQPLVIDPSLQVLSFFGGTLNDEAAGIATSAAQPTLSPTTAGVVFVGRSQSPSLPGPGLKPAGPINWDSFATGLNAGTVGVSAGAGTTILWTTYFGGSNDDAARGVAMDNLITGNSVYVTGYTHSTNFPFGVAVDYDAYIVKLNAIGGSIVAGTLYGGPFADQATSIALDYSTFSLLPNAVAITNPATDPQVTPNVVIGGLTSGGIGQAGSPAATTKTPDGKQGSFAGGTTDGFVAIFSSSLALLHATYIGGSGNDQVNGVAADIWGNIYATGLATPPTFPVTNGIAQTTLRTGWDASMGPLGSAVPFVAKWACTTGSPAIGVPSPPFGVVNGVNSQMPICGGTNNLKTLSNSALFGGGAEGKTFINPQQTVAGQPGITEAGLGIAVDQNGWGQEGVAGVTGGFANAAGFPDIVPISENGNNCNPGAQGYNNFNAQHCAVSASNVATTGGFEPGLSGPHVYVVGNTASRAFAGSLVFNASCITPPLVSSTVVPALCPTPYVFGAAVTGAGGLPGRSWCDPMGIANCPSGAVAMGQTTDLRIKQVTVGGVTSNSGQTQGWLVSFQFPAITQDVVTPPLSTQTTVTTLNPPTIPNYILLQPATCPSSGSGAAACVEGGGTVNSAVFAVATTLPAANFGCTNAFGVTCPTAFIGSWNAVAVDTEQQVYVIGQIGMSPFAGDGAVTPAVFGAGAPNRLALEIERISPYVNTPGGSGILQPNFCGGAADAPCAFPLEQFPTSENFGTDFIVDSATLTASATATATLTAGVVTSITVTSGGAGYTALPSCTITGGGGTGATCSLAAGGFTIVGGAVTGTSPCTTCITAGGTGFTSVPTVTLGSAPSNTLNSSYGQILPGAPPFPNPNQPGGLGNGIAVNPLREAFFVGTTTVVTPTPGVATQIATATANVTAGNVVDIQITNSGAGYLTLPTCTISGGGGTGATCSLAAGQAAGDIALGTGINAGKLIAGPACLAVPPPGAHNCNAAPGSLASFVCPSCVTAGGLVASYTSVPTVTLSPPPSTGNSLSFLAPSTILVPMSGAAQFPPPPVPAFQGNLGSVGGSNAGENCSVGADGINPPSAGNPCFGTGPEDVLYGAIQFYDAIASPTVVNFTATVNSFSSITAFNGQQGANAKAIINYSNWQGQQLNLPPGCTVTPNGTLVTTGVWAVGVGQGGIAPFLITQLNPSVPNEFLVTVNSTAAVLGPVAYPGVVTSVVTFNKAGPCTGVGQPPLESWDPITVTLTVSAPLNLSPESTFQITSKQGSGIVDQYFASGQQIAANQFVGTGIDVSTASSAGPINFTAQIVAGQNWAGPTVTGSVIVPTPTDIIYPAVGPNLGGPTRVNVGVNTLNLAALPVGTYTAWIMFTASPETPALPTSGSTACGPATVPVASGTTSPACIPIVITITPGVIANIPAALVFGASTTTQQTQVQISNPTSTPFNFTGTYQPTAVFGTALPAANFSFAGTATQCPSSVGATVSGTIAPGGICSLPIAINPAGLPTGVYSGQIVLSDAVLGATPQTTVPIIVYVGPHTGEDTPSGNGLGLMLPANVPPVGTGGSQGTGTGCPATAPASCAGGYPLTVSVPSGVGPSGGNQIPNPTLLQVTGLNNTSTTAFSVSAPTASGLTGVSFTNVGQGFGGTLGSCGNTYGSLASLPGSPLGPPCVWSLWVDATSLNSTNTTAMAACGGGRGETGTISFAPGGFPGATLVVPLTVCVTDFPSLILGMPNTFPNPTFGPTTGTGFGGCNGGNPDCLLAQPSNLIPGFPLSITDMILAASAGGSLGSTAAPINLLTLAGNSSEVCKVLDIRTNGGVVNNVTIAPLSVQWVSIQQAPAVFLGPTEGAPNSLPANSGAAASIFGLCAVLPGVPGCYTGGNPAYAVGPFQANPNMQTFQICVNTDPVGNASGTFSTTVTINGGGVGPITIPVNMVIGSGNIITPPPAVKFSQIGVFRPSTPVGGAQGVFALDANGNNAFDLPGDKIVPFGLAGDLPVAGDWDGTGVVRIGVYRPSNATWYLDMNNNGTWDGSGPGLDLAFTFGIPSATCVPSSAAGLAACGDIAIVGDWNGTGVTKVGIFRGGFWYLDNNKPGDPQPHTWSTFSYGQPGDLPVVANWSGTGTADQLGVYRRGTWYVDSNGDGIYEATDATFSYGSAGDIPVTGVWNGVGTKRIGVFNAIGQWFLDINGDHVFSAAFDVIANFGEAGDLPVVGGPWTMHQ